MQMPEKLELELYIKVGFDESNSLVHLLNSLDNPDNNDTIDLDISNYYSVSDFTDIALKYKDGFSILSLNVQSINAKGKFEEFSLFIETVSKLSDIKVICLQETWLSDESNTSLFELPNYSLIAHGKQCCKHAGLITYVHNSLKFKVIPQFYTMTN